MKSSKKNSRPVDAKALDPDLAKPEWEYIPQEEESDAVCALLRRVAACGSHESTYFPYREDLEEVDYTDEQALHRIVDDLQFGHDLRL